MPFFDHYPYTNLHNVNLDWVLQAVKSWGAMVEQNNLNFINLEAANQSFKEYVTNYLTNLNVSDEINAKLDEMLTSGQLTPYMQPYIIRGVENWLDEHITPTSPAIDTSLKIAGAAADAKATGEAIEKVYNKSNDRINDISDFTEDYVIWTVGYYINAAGNVIDPSTLVRDANSRYYLGEVKEGESFTLFVRDGGNARAYCFTDSNYNILEKSTASGTTFTGTITAPQGASYILINDSTNSTHYAYRVSNLLNTVRRLEELEVIPLTITHDTYNLIDPLHDMNWNHNIKNGGGITETTNAHTTFPYYPCEYGDVFLSNYHLTYIVLYDAQKAYLGMVSTGSQSDTYKPFRVENNNAAFVRPVWASATYSVTQNGLPINEIPLFFKTTPYGSADDQRLVVPKIQIDGRYIKNNFFNSAYPEKDSIFQSIMNLRNIRRINSDLGAIRFGTYNLYGAMIKYRNWPLISQQLLENGIDIVGFQEVTSTIVEPDVFGKTAHSLRKILNREEFPYADIEDDSESGKEMRIFSSLEIISHEYVEFQVSASNNTADCAYMHCVAKLPRYQNDWTWKPDKYISLYACHSPFSRSINEAYTNVIVDAINNDTTEYKAIMMDTNCVQREDMSEPVDLSLNNHPWNWAFFERCNMHAANSNFLYPTCAENAMETEANYNRGIINSYDVIFISDNMKCINWKILPAPVGNFSGGHYSDHCLVYADIIFDYVEGYGNM